MRQAEFWFRYGRGACGVATAACVGLAVAGCSSSFSRFDFPAFNLTDSSTSSTDGASADPSSTSALPPVLPEESVYSSGEGSRSQLTRASLPPPAYSPRPTVDYSPAPSGRVGAVEANYPARAAPHAESAPVRASQVQGRPLLSPVEGDRRLIDRHVGDGRFITLPVEILLRGKRKSCQL